LKKFLSVKKVLNFRHSLKFYMFFGLKSIHFLEFNFYLVRPYIIIHIETTNFRTNKKNAFIVLKKLRIHNKKIHFRNISVLSSLKYAFLCVPQFKYWKIKHIPLAIHMKWEMEHSLLYLLWEKLNGTDFFWILTFFKLLSDSHAICPKHLKSWRFKYALRPS